MSVSPVAQRDVIGRTITHSDVKKAARTVRLYERLESGHLPCSLGRSLRQPVPIRALIRSHSVRRQAGFRIGQTLPSLDFRMAIGKSQAAGFVMINGRVIHPSHHHARRWPWVPKAGVIDTLMVFVNEYPGVGCGHEIAFFAIGPKGISRCMTVIAIQPRPIGWQSRDSAVAAACALKTWAYSADSLIHGEAAKVRQPCSSRLPRISRAFVNSIIISCVGGQKIVFGISQRSRIQVL